MPRSMQPTALGGTLLRHAEGWRWCDGTPEPRARDESPDKSRFRHRETEEGLLLEVPASVAYGDRTLAWVLDGLRGGLYATSISLHHIGRDLGPSVILVPVEDWDRWANDNPAGAVWDPEDEEAILDRARYLGWDGEDA